jgi:Txe/YoeB family toxin of Txe-Axe toxin-antitoxin module
VTWGVVYYRARTGAVPAREFLLDCPTGVRAKLLAVLEVVRATPPPAFSGGGKWEAMHGKMSGYYEIRCTGPGRRHYRLYCILDNGTPKELAERGFDRPQIAVINGLVKPNATLFTDAEYARHVRKLGEEYRAKLPRPVAG